MAQAEENRPEQGVNPEDQERIAKIPVRKDTYDSDLEGPRTHKIDEIASSLFQPRPEEKHDAQMVKRKIRLAAARMDQMQPTAAFNTSAVVGQVANPSVLRFAPAAADPCA